MLKRNNVKHMQEKMYASPLEMLPSHHLLNDVAASCVHYC